MSDDQTNDGNPHEGIVSRADTASAYSIADAKKRKGNFIIPFGLPGSGKTTFLAALFKFINEAPGLQSEIQIPQRGKVPNYASQAMLNEWERIWRTGRFLEATQTGDDGIREISYQIKPVRGEKTVLKINVVEVSGEDLKKVIVESYRDPRLPVAIEATFANHHIRPMLMLIVHPDLLENDELFHNLFVYLRKHTPSQINKISLGILIANPKLALKRFKQRVPAMKVHEELIRKICPEYLREFAPKTYAIFEGWNKKKRFISAFYVGEVETFEDELDGPFEKITKYNDKHIKLIFSWIYTQFTGKKLGPKRWRRWFDQLND